ncbi:MAG: type II toxin-antitoxin system HicA family toxin [Flavobacteriaceae bacterium]|jgi:predicted RNA binding protein YcfA (HicA-like mRNA interferase family)|nr:type II toxin-antitoxin system HicA family toxin [Flavobacteriaceae bacterium]
MKYSELERAIKKTTNCKFFRNGRSHPLWINEDTGDIFAMSYHGSQEVKRGTLNDIIKKSGVKLK